MILLYFIPKYDFTWRHPADAVKKCLRKTVQWKRATSIIAANAAAKYSIVTDTVTLFLS